MTLIEPYQTQRRPSRRRQRSTGNIPPPNIRGFTSRATGYADAYRQQASPELLAESARRDAAYRNQQQTGTIQTPPTPTPRPQTPQSFTSGAAAYKPPPPIPDPEGLIPIQRAPMTQAQADALYAPAPTLLPAAITQSGFAGLAAGATGYINDSYQRNTSTSSLGSTGYADAFRRQASPELLAESARRDAAYRNQQLTGTIQTPPPPRPPSIQVGVAPPPPRPSSGGGYGSGGGGSRIPSAGLTADQRFAISEAEADLQQALGEHYRYTKLDTAYAQQERNQEAHRQERNRVNSLREAVTQLGALGGAGGEGTRQHAGNLLNEYSQQMGLAQQLRFQQARTAANRIASQRERELIAQRNEIDLQRARAALSAAAGL